MFGSHEHHIVGNACDAEVGNVQGLGVHIAVQIVSEQLAELGRIDVLGSQYRLVRIQTSTRIIVVVGEHAEKTSRSCGCPIASSDDLTRRWIGRMCGLGEQEE